MFAAKLSFFIFAFLALFIRIESLEQNQSTVASNTISKITSYGDTLWVLHGRDDKNGISVMRDLNSWTNYTSKDFADNTIFFDILEINNRIFATGAVSPAGSRNLGEGFINEFDFPNQRWNTKKIKWKDENTDDRFGLDLASAAQASDTSLYVSFAGGGLLKFNLSNDSISGLVFDTIMDTISFKHTYELSSAGNAAPFQRIVTIASDTINDTLWLFAGSNAGLYRKCLSCSAQIWERIITDTVIDTIIKADSALKFDTIGLGDSWKELSSYSFNSYSRYTMSIRINSLSNTVWGYVFNNDAEKNFTKLLQNYSGLIRSRNCGKNWEKVRFFKKISGAADQNDPGGTVYSLDTLVPDASLKVTDMDFWNDTVFMATGSGVYVITNDTIIKEFNSKNSLPSNKITCLHIKPDSARLHYELWIGT
ncbi:MAG: hypothetical protein ABIA63_15455, partial [bacterium]